MTCSSNHIDISAVQDVRTIGFLSRRPPCCDSFHGSDYQYTGALFQEFAVEQRVPIFKTLGNTKHKSFDVLRRPLCNKHAHRPPHALFALILLAHYFGFCNMQASGA